MDDAPLWDASFSEVLARVAYQVILKDYRRWGQEGDNPLEYLRGLEHAMEYHKFYAISAWISAYRYGVSQGQRSGVLRTQYIMRARMGLLWRQVAFIEYKANRRRDPRVTNRGVITSGTRRGGR